MRAMVAMSGGVDSSVAAALMREAGHDVIGVTLKLWSGPGGEAPTAGCCTLSDAEDARRVAAALDIPYYVLDYTEEFREGVVSVFIDDYAHGRTPNPCIECNRTVKFDRLLNGLDELGCDVLVTGHHARVRSGPDGWELHRGADMAKDQSYVLSMLTSPQLGRTRFPVGEMTKTEVRARAAELGLRTAAKAESMEICFVGRGDYRSFLDRHAPSMLRPGPVIDHTGEVLGAHGGVGGFTVGQRRGLGIAAGEPRYVVSIDATTATVVIGRREDLLVRTVELEGLSTVSGRPLSGRVEAQYRAHGAAMPATLAGGLLHFDEPQMAVAPGQTVAFYESDRVLGGAVIAATG
ncbi:MAG: tRNA 2-thiouridine(34) synthase MnmA [Actinobacteria bacterium]|nr:tRNA 2-thiouridine(34) synthase MnmA [Actinomycetota bacterium]